MRIVVCIKQVPDPEGPQNCFQINPETLRVEPKGIPPVISLFDENALEAALRIKDEHQEGVTITLISMGKRISNAVLEKAMAVGADELVKAEDDAFEAGGLDSSATASVLAATIKKLEPVDLILTGRQAADWNAGQVGIGVGRILDLPIITLARKVAVAENNVVVERVIPGGYEVVKAVLPALVVVSNEAGGMRYPTMIQRRAAKKKPTEAWDADEIGLSSLPMNRVVLKKLFPSVMRQAECQLIEEESPDKAGRSLAQRLRHDGVL
jgi:electron transfer flavoprotein beta subunit